jgi:hypothetical protein
MDIADLAQSDNTAVAASLLVFIEGARTMSNLVGDKRFSSPYGGEIMGATYTGVLGLLASAVTKNPLPTLTAMAAVVFFTVLYHWQENQALKHTIKSSIE